MGPDAVAEQEKIASALVGHRLTGVAYLTLDVEGYQPTWNGPGGDSIDFGVDLDFDDHPLSVGWIPPAKDTEGLQVTRDALLGWRDVHANRVDVGDTSRWSSGASTSYLVGVRLSFANEQKVTLTLAEFVCGQTVRSATNVVVIFDDVAAP